MSDNFHWDEKDEKKDEKDEKDVSKHEEKTIEEKWRRDPLGTVAWAIVLIWSGVVLLLVNNTTLLDQIQFHGQRAWGLSSPVWSLIFVGAGVIFMVEALLRLAIPAYRKPVWGSIIFAIILIALGLGNVFDWRILGAVILIFIGISMLLRPK